MLSSVFVGFLMATGTAGWVYAKVMRRTGNNSQTTAIVTGLVWVMVFVVTLTLMSIVNSATGN